MTLLSEQRPLAAPYANPLRHPIDRAHLLAQALQSRGSFEARNFLESNGFFAPPLEASPQEIDALVVEVFEEYQARVHGLGTVRILPLAGIRTPDFRLEILVSLARIDQAEIFEILRRYTRQTSTYMQRRTLLAYTRKKTAFMLQTLAPAQAAELVNHLTPTQVASFAFDLSRLVYATQREIHQSLYDFLQQSHKVRNRGADWCREVFVDYVSARPERAAEDLWTFWNTERPTQNLAVELGIIAKACKSALLPSRSNRAG